MALHLILWLACLVLSGSLTVFTPFYLCWMTLLCGSARHWESCPAVCINICVPLGSELLLLLAPHLIMLMMQIMFFFFFCFSFTLSDPADVKRKMVLFVSSFPKDLFSIDCHHRKAVLLSSFFFLRENVAYCVCPMSDWLFFTWWPISLLILNSQPAFFVVYQ